MRSQFQTGWTLWTRLHRWETPKRKTLCTARGSLGPLQRRENPMTRVKTGRNQASLMNLREPERPALVI